MLTCAGLNIEYRYIYIHIDYKKADKELSIQDIQKKDSKRYDIVLFDVNNVDLL